MKKKKNRAKNELNKQFPTSTEPRKVKYVYYFRIKSTGYFPLIKKYEIKVTKFCLNANIL